MIASSSPLLFGAVLACVFQVMKSFAEAIAEAKVDVVPRVVIGGGASARAMRRAVTTCASPRSKRCARSS